MLEWIYNNIDLVGLRYFNLQWPQLDKFWLCVSHLDRQNWFIFGVFPCLMLTLFYIYGMRLGKLLMVLALVVGTADLISYRVIKAEVRRARPFENALTRSWVRKVDDAHGSSFPSNHATNCFAGASVLGWYFKKRRHYFYTFAAIVGLSRIALGVHFPSDVLAGGALGCFVAFLIKCLLFNRFPWFSHIRQGREYEKEVPSWRRRVSQLNNP